MKKVFITGVSGTGKTTVAKELEKRGYYAVSIDEVDGLCSWINHKTGKPAGDEELNLEFIDSHDWICDINYLEKLLSENVEIGFVLGRAGNQDDFLHIFDKILILECSPETFCKRIEDRTDNDFGKDKEVQQRILEGYEHYAKEMLGKGAISINTEQPVNEVVDRIIEVAAA